MDYRLAEQKDLESILKLLSLSFSTSYAYYARKSFTTPEHVLVAEEGNRLIGVINWRLFELKGENIGYLFGWQFIQMIEERE